MARVWIAAAWVGTVGTVCWIAVSYVLPEDLARAGPIYSRVVVVAFFGRVFTFHSGLALAASSAAAIAGRRWRLLGISALAAAACLTPTIRACVPRRPAAVVGSPLRLMAINLEYSNAHYDLILSRIREIAPDVITVEEFTELQRDHLVPALSDRYPHQCLRPAPGGRGLALFSRLPFAEPPRADTFEDRSQIRAVVPVAGRPVAVYAVHPYAPLSRWAIVQNRLQTADYLRQFAAERLPVIAAGDWNFTSETANAAAIRYAGLTDAFDGSGLARGSTWPVRPRWKSWLPGVRIDHVYLTPRLACSRYVTGTFDGSDHLPIVADVGFVATGG